MHTYFFHAHDHTRLRALTPKPLALIDTELDFLNELANQDEVKRLLLQENVRGVYVPKTYRALSSRKVLVTEWMDGVKLSECAPAEVKSLIAVGQEAFLVMLLQVGLFHADPHPGNLMRLDDSMRSVAPFSALKCARWFLFKNTIRKTHFWHD